LAARPAWSACSIGVLKVASQRTPEMLARRAGQRIHHPERQRKKPSVGASGASFTLEFSGQGLGSGMELEPMRSVGDVVFERALLCADRRILRRLVTLPGCHVRQGRPVPEWPRAWML